MKPTECPPMPIDSIKEYLPNGENGAVRICGVACDAKTIRLTARAVGKFHEAQTGDESAPFLKDCVKCADIALCQLRHDLDIALGGIARGIAIQRSGGNVILRGEVMSAAQRHVAADVVRSHSDIWRVANLLTVMPDPLKDRLILNIQRALKEQTEREAAPIYVVEFADDIDWRQLYLIDCLPCSPFQIEMDPA